MDDRHWLALATGLTLVSSGWGTFALGAGRTQSTGWNNALLAAAWLCQSVFLYERGARIGHCPLTNLFEIVAFITWALLLSYLLIGTGYRVSLLGFFTAPVVSLLNFFALVAPIDVWNAVPPRSGMIELHASVTLLAYGALGLAAVAALLFLIQERQLKAHDLGRWFYRLPAMGDLAAVQRRVLLWGFLLLTVGLVAGLAASRTGNVDWVKLVWSIGVWIVYLLLILAPRFLRIGSRRLAWCSLLGYLFVLLTFWGINSLSHLHRFTV